MYSNQRDSGNNKELRGDRGLYLQALELCLISTYFLFHGQVYEQTEGAAMGSPLSPIIAEIFMNYSENTFLNSAFLRPKLWLRYVDNCLLIWNHGEEKLQHFLIFVNNQHVNIKFAMETEVDQKLPFLDVLITRKEEGNLGFKIYRKPTPTNKYTDASSHHHPAQLAGIMKTLFHRMNKLCDKESIKKENENLKKAFLLNGFSSKQIEKAARVKENGMENNQLETEKEDTKGFTVIPYVKGTSERIGRVLKKHNIRTVFKPHKKLSEVVRSVKDDVDLRYQDSLTTLTHMLMRVRY